MQSFFKMSLRSYLSPVWSQNLWWGMNSSKEPHIREMITGFFNFLFLPFLGVNLHKPRIKPTESNFGSSFNKFLAPARNCKAFSVLLCSRCCFCLSIWVSSLLLGCYEKFSACPGTWDKHPVNSSKPTLSHELECGPAHLPQCRCLNGLLLIVLSFSLILQCSSTCQLPYAHTNWGNDSINGRWMRHETTHDRYQIQVKFFTESKLGDSAWCCWFNLKHSGLLTEFIGQIKPWELWRIKYSLKYFSDKR